MTLGEIRRRPTLPGRFQPSTISVLRLNFCVRDGNRWIPQAIVTGNQSGFGSLCCRALCFRLSASAFLTSFQRFRSGLRTLKTAQVASLRFARPRLPAAPLRHSSSLFLFLQDQALDRLVSSSSIRYRTSTDDLSTLSSSRGLTCF